MGVSTGTGGRVRPLPPSPPQLTSPIPPPPSSVGRVMSETRPMRRLPLPPEPAPPQAVLNAWEKENWIKKPGEFSIPYIPESKRKKYGYDLPTHPRDAILKGKTLRHSPDSRRLNTKRDIDNHTIEIMRERLGDQGDIYPPAMKSSGFRAVDANYPALNTTYSRVDEGRTKARLEQQRQRESLDLAVSRKASVQSEGKSSFQTERKGSGATMVLPDFRILHGSVPLSPGQGIPESPDPESPHAAFEWDNPSPFGGPLFSPHWNQTWNSGRPTSVEEAQSASRKASQPELDMELAKKPRPATLPSSANRANRNLTEVERKRLGGDSESTRCERSVREEVWSPSRLKSSTFLDNER
ncbi:hypothetical protein OPQ81_010018 [Rhizoctonia solani]|nr:hypothetical protein OPQ81_010018 [Rhizoctonia solani]